MSNFKIQKIWQDSYEDYCHSGHFQSQEQKKASLAILACKSGRLGVNVSECTECGHMEFHKNSCRNRSCPNCQAVLKEVWVDQRRAEVMDAPYFHVVFTLPHELNPLMFCNQKLLYGLLHKCCAQTILELSADRKYLGAQPGIIQVLHTWNQELGYHVHMHCIISGGGAGLPLTTGSVDPPLSFLSLSGYSGISLRGNIFLCWTPAIKRGNLFFRLPAVLCRIPASGRCSKTAFMRKAGAHISKKPSTVSGMRSNTWDGIPTGSPSPTTGCHLQQPDPVRDGNRGHLLRTGEKAR